MSVRTTADEHLDKAREDIRSAFSNLLKALEPDTWGSDSFNEETIDNMTEAVKKLFDIKKLLK